jgi:hypothetical protein
MYLRWPGIDPGSTAWKAAMLTIIINCKVGPMVLIKKQSSRQFVDHVVENRFGKQFVESMMKN